MRRGLWDVDDLDVLHAMVCATSGQPLCGNTDMQTHCTTKQILDGSRAPLFLVLGLHMMACALLVLRKRVTYIAKSPS